MLFKRHVINAGPQCMKFHKNRTRLVTSNSTTLTIIKLWNIWTFNKQKNDVSVQNNGNSCWIIWENNDASCLQTDIIFLSWKRDKMAKYGQFSYMWNSSGIWHFSLAKIDKTFHLFFNWKSFPKHVYHSRIATIISTIILYSLLIIE